MKRFLWVFSFLVLAGVTVYTVNATNHQLVQNCWDWLATDWHWGELLAAIWIATFVAVFFEALEDPT